MNKAKVRKRSAARKPRQSEHGKLAQIFHDFYTERWNSHYSQCNEPGWAISDDVARLLQMLDAPFGGPAEIKKPLAKILASKR